MRERDLEEWLGICTFLILSQGEEIMAALDDANNALATLNGNVDALVTRVGAIATGVPEADVETLAQGIQAVADRVNTIAP